MSQVVQAPESGAELPPFRSIRGFHVGGSIVELSDAPARSLETVPGLQALAELAEVAGVDAAGVAAIRQGRRIADVELRQALASTQPCRLVDAFKVGDDATLFGGLFSVEAPSGPDPDNSYNRWLARQPKRFVQD